MKITHKPPQSPPMVRYGDLERGRAYRAGTPYSTACIKGDCEGDYPDWNIDDQCTCEGEDNDILVIPLDAELVIHGFAHDTQAPVAQLEEQRDSTSPVEGSSPSGRSNEIADLRAELDRVTRERDVLREGLQDLVEHGGDVPGLAASRLLDDADRIRREAERGEEG